MWLTGDDIEYAFFYACMLAPVAAFVAVLIISLMRVVRQDRRHQQTQCPDCGYRLQGLPPGTIHCPECGYVLWRGR